jgi:hypothetical protein
MTDDITQDTLDFQLIAEHTVVNTTVKLVAKIEALANLQTEDDLRSDIRKTLKSFIDADWQFSNMLRVSDNTGYERICLTASVRVSESENYNLIDRAKAVSRKGLQIIDVDADTSIPSKQISEAESDLRVELIQRASAERVKLSKAAGRNYRVHSMLFSSVGKTRQVINNPATKMAYGQLKTRIATDHSAFVLAHGDLHKIIQKFINVDPTPNKKYVQWMIRTYLKSGIRYLEDLSRTNAALILFDKNKIRLPVEQRDNQQNQIIA